MKKILAVAMTAVMGLSLAACGGSSGSSAGSSAASASGASSAASASGETYKAVSYTHLELQGYRRRCGRSAQG